MYIKKEHIILILLIIWSSILEGQIISYPELGEKAAYVRDHKIKKIIKYYINNDDTVYLYKESFNEKGQCISWANGSKTNLINYYYSAQLDSFKIQSLFAKTKTIKCLQLPERLFSNSCSFSRDTNYIFLNIDNNISILVDENKIKTEFKYDTAGHLLQINLTDLKGDINSHTQYEYRDNNEIVENYRINDEYGTKDFNYYLLTKFRMPLLWVKKAYKNNAINGTIITQYFYDLNGVLEKEFTINEQGINSRIYFYSYELF